MQGEEAMETQKGAGSRTVERGGKKKGGNLKNLGGDEDRVGKLVSRNDDEEEVVAGGWVGVPEGGAEREKAG